MLVRDDDVGLGVLVHLAGEELGADAAVGVDASRDERGGAGGVAVQLEPIKHRVGVRFVVALDAVGPAALAADDVGQAVAVHVAELDRMDLAEALAVGVVFLGLAEDDVLLEGAVGVLFEPGQAVAVGLDARDDVVTSVLVHVVDVHLGATDTEIGGVELPVGVLGNIGGLFIPAVGFEDVHAAVAVDVAGAVAVRILEDLLVVGLVLRRDRTEAGLAERILPIDLGEAELSAVAALVVLRILHAIARVAEELRLAVAVHVDELGGLAVGDVEDVVDGPRASLALRVFVDEGGVARETEYQDILPAVGVEVVGV